MKRFVEYLAESTRDYKYRIRTLLPLNKDLIGKIADELAPYNIITISKPKKTILQDSPLDFQHAGMAEVYMVDITTTVPVPPEAVRQQLRGTLNINLSDIVVRNMDDPLEIETALESRKPSDEPLLSTSPEYKEYNIGMDKPQAFGDEYNKRFLDYLSSVANNREDNTAKVQPENQPFKLFAEFSAEDFNKGYDTPKPVSKVKNASEPLDDIAPEGNFSTYRRTMKSLGEK